MKSTRLFELSPETIVYTDINDLRLADKRALAYELLSKRHKLIEKEREVPFYVADYDKKLYDICLKELSRT